MKERYKTLYEEVTELIATEYRTVQESGGLLMRAEWKKYGRSVPKSALPAKIEQWYNYMCGSAGERHLFTFEQTRPMRAKQQPVILDDIVACLLTLNRHAKRCRDSAQVYYQRSMHGFAGAAKRKKEHIYNLKNQAIAWLLVEGVLQKTDDYNRFKDGNVAQIVTDGRYRFHVPVPPVPDAVSVSIEQLEQIDARPKGATEVKLCDALATVESYLHDKVRIDTYQWPARVREPKVITCWSCGESGHTSRQCPLSSEIEDQFDSRGGYR